MKNLMTNFKTAVMSFAVLTLAACSSGGGPIDPKEASSAAPPVPYSARVTETSFGEGDVSVMNELAGVWRGEATNTEYGDYGLNVLIDEDGNALVSLSFISDQVSTSFNGINLFAAPVYFNNQSGKGFELAMKTERSYWHSPTVEHILFGMVRAHLVGGVLNVDIELERLGELVMFTAEAYRLDAAPVGDGGAVEPTITHNGHEARAATSASFIFEASNYDFADGAFMFMTGDCMANGTFLASAEATVARYVLDVECEDGSYAQGFTGRYVGLSYRDDGFCRGEAADKLYFKGINAETGNQIHPYACWAF